MNEWGGIVQDILVGIGNSATSKGKIDEVLYMIMVLERVPAIVVFPLLISKFIISIVRFLTFWTPSDCSRLYPVTIV